MFDPVLFGHEKLKVYQRALAFFSLADEMATRWDVKHAITDHFPRAAESIVLNLAEASAAVSGVKQKSLDVALGSTLECAACLDIAQVKELIDREALALGASQAVAGADLQDADGTQESLVRRRGARRARGLRAGRDRTPKRGVFSS